MKRRRVKITGIGPVTPAGIGREEFWKGILEPVSRVRTYTHLGGEFGPFAAAYIDGFDIGNYVDRSKLPRGIARHSMFAVAAAKLALVDAGIGEEELPRARCAVITGSATMDFGGVVGSIDAVRQKGVRGALPRVLSAVGIGSAASAISTMFGITGRTVGVSNQCISGLDAMGYAAGLVASGEVEIALCGGTEAPLHRFPMLEFRAAGLTPASSELPERISRPFDLWRTTGVVSEGACVFVIEPDSSPRKAYSHIASYACANDEEGDLCGGMAVAGRLAIADARLRPSQIEVINAWGPGHKEIDRAESIAMHSLFGAALSNIAAVSIKGAIGMPLGAAPAMQVAAAALAQSHDVLPPTVNWDFPDPECALSLSNKPFAMRHDVTLINAHGFGSVNSSMILERR